MKNIKLNACLIGIMLVCLIVLRTPTTAADDATIVSAGGPYTGVESQTITFAGISDYRGSLQYRWDFNNDSTWDTPWLDCTYNDQTGNWVAIASYTYYDEYHGSAIFQVADPYTNYTSTATARVDITNVNPAITSITTPVNTVQTGTEAPITVTFFDGYNGTPSTDTHTVTIGWGDGTQTTITLPSGVQNTSGTHVYSQTGNYTVTVTVTDDDGGSGTSTSQTPIQIYEPNPRPYTTGFLTGGGWIVVPYGSYRSNPGITGTANFGINAKYKKGQNTPTGETEFNFQEATLNFHSGCYDWLVVSSSGIARSKGTGTINGAGTYGFIITVIDGKIHGGPDTFRIQIWDKATGTMIFDNNANTPLSGGQIVIHRA